MASPASAAAQVAARRKRLSVQHGGPSKGPFQKAQGCGVQGGKRLTHGERAGLPRPDKAAGLKGAADGGGPCNFYHSKEGQPSAAPLWLNGTCSALSFLEDLPASCMPPFRYGALCLGGSATLADGVDQHQHGDDQEGNGHRAMQQRRQRAGRGHKRRTQ